MRTAFPGVYQTRGGRFQIRYCVNGKRQPQEMLPRRITTAAAAAKERANRIHDGEEGRLPVAASRVTFELIVEQLRADHEAQHRKASLKLAHLTEAFGGRKAREIDYRALQRYVADRQAAGAADATIHNELAALRRAFTLAVRAGLLAARPAFPMPKVVNTVVCWFTVAELDQLLARLPEAFRGPVEFAALSGWRRGNVFALAWAHVDFHRGTVRAPAGTTKNGDPILTPFAVGSRLNAVLRAAERATGGAGRVFPTEAGLNAAWKRAVKALGKWGEQYDARRGAVARVRPRFHDLRHTFAQHATEAGADQRTIMELAGWKTPAMFDRYHVKTDAAKRAAVARLDAHVAAERAAAAREARQVIDLKRQVGGGR